MAKLTEKERFGFEQILQKDLIAINAKFMNQIKDFWAISRKEVLKKRGWNIIIQEREKLLKDKEQIKKRLHEIEIELNDEKLLPEQIVELGGKPNEYGRYDGSNFYGIPVTSQLEYEMVDYIRNRIDLEIPAKILHDICEASIRELTMSGTFEEARNAYEKFYSLNFRQYGVDIPPRLSDITTNKKMITYAGDSLNQIKKLESPKEPEKEKK